MFTMVIYCQGLAVRSRSVVTLQIKYGRSDKYDRVNDTGVNASDRCNVGADKQQYQ